VLVFDGNCALCTSCAHVLKRIGAEAEIIPWQVPDDPARVADYPEVIDLRTCAH
jgi:predicted DCC family thiol-disulfide oxidoreductase YuxK